MSMTGVCQICEAAEARFTCDNCGALVCADHYDEQTGCCVECAQSMPDNGGPGFGVED
ncbi:zinc finger HIT domain-containing protein [Halobaculum sp. D14]|uniref:zinc finger HIT domain-containing protein n=1 Tax=Halobaculum sp. D14 TaxID=3421642 RepID=UPI003EB972B8